MRQGFAHAFAQRGRAFNQHIAQRAEEIRKLLFTPIENVLGKQPSTGTEFDDLDALRGAERSPHFFELASQKTSKNRMDVTRRVKVAGLAELLRVPRVITEFG